MGVGEGPLVGQVKEKKKPDNWPKESKDPEGLPYVNDLTASLLYSFLYRGHPHPFSPGLHLCLCLNYAISL